MKECGNCGNYIPNDVGICPHCGKWERGIWWEFNKGKLISGGILLFISLLALCFVWVSDSIAGTFSNLAILIPLVLISGYLLSAAFSGSADIRAAERETKQRWLHHKRHRKHDFSDSCYCSVCGKKEKR
jgi:hypothetical protein